MPASASRRSDRGSSPSTERHRELTEEFLAAVTDGDLAGLERLLADDVVFYADGGGKAPAIQHPLHGATPVARFLLGLVRRGLPMGVRLEPVVANGQPAVRLADREGAVLGVLALEIVDGRVVAFRNQINPDKLGHLGPVGDMFAMLAEGPRLADRELLDHLVARPAPGTLAEVRRDQGDPVHGERRAGVGVQQAHPVGGVGRPVDPGDA